MRIEYSYLKHTRRSAYGGCPVHTTQLPGSQSDRHRPTRIANSGRTYGVWDTRHQAGVACNHISAGRERVGGASVCYASQPPCKLRNALSVCQGSPHAPPCKGTGLEPIGETLPGKRGRCWAGCSGTRRSSKAAPSTRREAASDSCNSSRKNPREKTQEVGQQEEEHPSTLELQEGDARAN